MFALLIALVLAVTAPVAADAMPNADPSDDPYLWLEDVDGERALDWVRARNDETAAVLQTSAFDTLEKRVLGILDSDARIPYVEKLGPWYYNFWTDAKNPRGLWRRTTFAEYRKQEPAWETVLDLDALGAAEHENWVWKGADCLKPAYKRCLVSLSRGGADAHVVREFDLETKDFVASGFTVSEAKTNSAWLDADTLYVATDFGPGSMTTSGYARIVKIWKRGTPLESAETLFEAKGDDMLAYAVRDHTKGYERDFVGRLMTFYTNEMYVRRGSELVKIDKPDSSKATIHRDLLLLELREDWSIGGATYAAGALIAIDFEAFLSGARRFDILFSPTARKSLAAVSPTLNAILVNELDNVHNRVYALRRTGGKWTRAALPAMSRFGTVSVGSVDADESDDYFMAVTDFVTPTRLFFGSIGKRQPGKRETAKREPEMLKRLPEFFDATGLVVTQHEVASKDGTKIPYFEVSRQGTAHDASNPTLLYGYGGFEVSMVPQYSATLGAGWLEKGGTYVLANIRGGGEFGPQWHRAALKANRHKAYEDFIAVAEDLVRRKVTRPRHLGIQGGSNGGLLVGNMLTMRPDLFGAVVCQVPLLDMRRYHRLLAGASWMDEYGDPDDPREWSFIRTFSPYHNVKSGVTYPPSLLMTSTRDDRVHPAHARKMAAKMRDAGQSVLYYENIEGGHGGAADNRQLAHMYALAYTFLWKHLR
jgi:prolyl oligopeptidase